MLNHTSDPLPAQASNKHKAPSEDFGFDQQSDLERFTDNLQSQLLNDLLSDSLQGTDPVNQTLTTGDFIVNLNKQANGSLTVTIQDTSTGETSVIELASN